MGNRIVPFGKEVYIERSDFFDLYGPEGVANGGNIPKGFKRLLPDDKVRLKYAYVIQCDEVVRDEKTNEPVALKCSYFKDTRSGVTPEGMCRVNGIIQWVEGSTAIKCRINQYDRLFKVEEPGKETGNFLDDINTDSLQVLEDCLLEPSVEKDALEMMELIETHTEDPRRYHSELSYQFERSGYFALDSDSSKDRLIFNRVVTLRDTWTLNSKGGEESSEKESGRNRGVNNNDNKLNQSSNTDVLEDVLRVSIRAGTILEASAHPDADNLVVLKVDVGDDNGQPRTVVAGLGGKMSLESLIHRKVACVTNLKPAKMRGIDSFAMLLGASDGVKVELLDVPAHVPNGELMHFEGKGPSRPDEMMKSKGAIKAFERVKDCLRVNDDGNVVYRFEGKDYLLKSSMKAEGHDGTVKASSLKNVMVQ